MNGRPSGPRQSTRWPGARVVDQRRRDADSLAENREAGRRARARRAALSKTENGRRSSGSMPAPGLHHDELAGRGGRGNRRRGEREDVVVARQRPVRDHARRDIDRHRGSILRPRNALPADAEQLDAAAAALATAYVIALVLHLNPNLPLHPVAAAAARLDRRPLLRRAPDRDLLHPARAPAAARARSVFAGVDQRRRAGLAGCRGGRGRRRADVAEPRHVRARARPATADGARSQRDRADGDAVLCVLLAVFRRNVPERASRSGRRCSSLDRGRRRSRRRWRCAAAARRRCSRRGRSTRRSTARPEPSGAGHVIAIDARVARPHHPRDRRRTPAELRPDSRRRCRASSRDAAPDLGRSGVGGGRDRASCRRRTASDRRRSISSPAAAARCSCCPTTASRTGSSGSAFSSSRRTRRRRSARGRCGASSAPNGFSVGVVGWPLTQPAPVVRGYLVSDTYHRVALTPSGIDDPSAIYPPELQARRARRDGERRRRRRRRSCPASLRRRAPRNAGAHRSHLRPHRAGDGARAAGAGDAHALPEPRSDRPLLSPLRDPVGVRRRHRRRAAAARLGARAALRA